MNIEINKKINTSSIAQTPTSSPISKENDGKFASELKSLSVEKESKSEPSSQKIEKTDVIKEESAVKTVETTPTKKKTTTENNTKTDKKETENVKSTSPKETNKTETVEKEENSFTKQDEKPKKLQAEKTEDAVLFPKDTEIANEFEKIGEVKDISESFEKNIDQKIIFENKRPNIENEKIIDTNNQIIDKKKPILKDEEVLALKSFENKDKFDINKQNKVINQEIKPEPQISIAQPEQKVEQNDEIFKSGKTTKQHKNIKPENKQNPFKKQDANFDDLVKTDLIDKDNEEVIQNNNEINIHDEIDETLATTTRVITGLQDAVKEIKQKTSGANNVIETFNKNETKTKQEPDKETEIIVNDKEEDTGIKANRIVEHEIVQEIKPQVTRKSIKEEEEEKEVNNNKSNKITESNNEQENIVPKKEQITQDIDIKNKKSEYSEERNSEENELIDNNFNIQEKKDILLPQMNASMDFNSNGQPFSDFINPNKEKDELKSSQKDLEEENAILSTMAENMAIANQNIVKKVENKKVENTKTEQNQKTENDEIEYKKVNNIFEPVNNYTETKIEKPKAEIKKPIEQPKANVEEPKAEVKKPIEHPTIKVEEPKAEVKKPIEQPKVKVEEPKAEVKKTIEQPKVKVEEPKVEVKKPIEQSNATVEETTEQFTAKVEEPKVEVQKAIEQPKAKVEEAKVEVKKPIEQPTVKVEEPKVEIKKPIEQPTVKVEEPKVKIKKPIEQPKVKVEEPKHEIKKAVIQPDTKIESKKAVKHDAAIKDIQEVQSINEIKVVDDDNLKIEKHEIKTAKNNTSNKNEKIGTIASTIVEDIDAEEQFVQPKTKTVTTDEGVKKVDKQTNITVETVVKYETVVMDKSDVDFFTKLVENGEVEMKEVQHSQKSAHVSKSLADLLAKAMQDNKPVRIDFDNNISIIIKVGRDGKISADFLPSSQVAETYLKENLPLLRQRFDDNNIEYDSLNQRKQNNKDNQENRRKGRKNE